MIFRVWGKKAPKNIECVSESTIFLIKFVSYQVIAVILFLYCIIVYIF